MRRKQLPLWCPDPVLWLDLLDVVPDVPQDLEVEEVTEVRPHDHERGERDGRVDLGGVSVLRREDEDA